MTRKVHDFSALAAAIAAVHNAKDSGTTEVVEHPALGVKSDFIVRGEVAVPVSTGFPPNDTSTNVLLRNFSTEALAAAFHPLTGVCYEVAKRALLRQGGTAADCEGLDRLYNETVKREVEEWKRHFTVALANDQLIGESSEECIDTCVGIIQELDLPDATRVDLFHWVKALCTNHFAKTTIEDSDEAKLRAIEEDMDRRAAAAEAAMAA